MHSVLFIQPYGNKTSNLSWVKRLKKTCNITFIGKKELDGDDDSLKIMGETILFNELFTNDYDLIICNSRGGEVLFHAMNKKYRMHFLSY